MRYWCSNILLTGTFSFDSFPFCFASFSVSRTSCLMNPPGMTENRGGGDAALGPLSSSLIYLRIKQNILKCSFCINIVWLFHAMCSIGCTVASRCQCFTKGSSSSAHKKCVFYVWQKKAMISKCVLFLQQKRTIWGLWQKHFQKGKCFATHSYQSASNCHSYSRFNDCLIWARYILIIQYRGKIFSFEYILHT